MIRRMLINGSDVQVSAAASCLRQIADNDMKNKHSHFVVHCLLILRSSIAHLLATQTVWQWTGWEETCTGAIRDGTLLRYQS